MPRVSPLLESGKGVGSEVTVSAVVGGLFDEEEEELKRVWWMGVVIVAWRMGREGTREREPKMAARERRGENIVCFCALYVILAYVMRWNRRRSSQLM